MQSETPATVSASGVTFVPSRPRSERLASRRASSVYVRLTRSAVGVGLTPARTLPPTLAVETRRGGDAARLGPGDHRPAEEGGAEAGRDVQPEVVARRHDGEPDPGGPERPEHAQPAALDERGEGETDDERVGGVHARHR